jgi:hypothetical protein
MPREPHAVQPFDARVCHTPSRIGPDLGTYGDWLRSSPWPRPSHKRGSGPRHCLAAPKQDASAAEPVDKLPSAGLGDPGDSQGDAVFADGAILVADE